MPQSDKFMGVEQLTGLSRRKYKEMDIHELITYCQNDDYTAIEELIRREQKQIYASFYYLDPERSDHLDLTQEALLRMSKNIKSLKNPRTFKSWLGQIISNLFYDQLRKKQRSLNVVSADFNWDDEHTSCPIFDVRDNKAKPDENTIRKELSEVIVEMISRLPDHFKFVIVMREIEGLSYEEIAKITKTNVGTVKSRIARARNRLQESLKPYVI